MKTSFLWRLTSLAVLLAMVISPIGFSSAAPINTVPAAPQPGMRVIDAFLCRYQPAAALVGPDPIRLENPQCVAQIAGPPGDPENPERRNKWRAGCIDCSGPANRQINARSGRQLRGRQQRQWSPAARYPGRRRERPRYRHEILCPMGQSVFRDLGCHHTRSPGLSVRAGSRQHIVGWHRHPVRQLQRWRSNHPIRPPGQPLDDEPVCTPIPRQLPPMYCRLGFR